MHFLAGLALLLLIGLLTGGSLMVYAAYVVIAVIATSRFCARRWNEAITVDRKLIGGEYEIGDEISVGIQVKNSSKWFVPWIFVEDVIARRLTELPPIALERSGDSIYAMRLGAGQSRLLTYKLTFLRRGYYQIGPTVIESGDMFGLQRKYRVASQPDFILVYPKLIPLQGYDVQSRRPIGEIRLSYRREEDPTLMAGIREYQMGDSMNRVHWRATARTGKLHSKIYQPTCVAGAMIVLDLHVDSNPANHEPVRSDLAITATASICHTLYQMGQQFGIVSNARDAVDRIRTEGWESDARTREEALRSVAMQDENTRLHPLIVPANRGAEHFQEAFRTLARMELSSGLKLPELILESQHRLPRDASVIVVVQEVDEMAAMTLAMLRRQGFAVTAIVNNYASDAADSATSRLVGHRIPTWHLHDESSIPDICRRLILRY